MSEVTELFISTLTIHNEEFVSEALEAADSIKFLKATVLSEAGIELDDSVFANEDSDQDRGVKIAEGVYVQIQEVE